MKANKVLSTKKIMENQYAVVRDCLKLKLDNIVFPKWSDLGLQGMLLRQCVCSKEQPQGNIYDEAVYQMVLRVIGGKVLITGRPDTYCWEQKRVMELIEDPSNLPYIGVNSAKGLINLSKVLLSIDKEEDQTLLADMFSNSKRDYLLLTTPEEKRKCIEVTQELFDSGITYCVDQWMKTDDNGDAEATNLVVGDFLIVTKKGLYRVGKDEFAETHSLT